MKRIFLSCVLGAALAACGGSESDSGAAVECPDDSTLTYESFGAGFMSSYCLECHSVSSQDRQLAPPGTDYDTAAQVRHHAAKIAERAAGSGANMPPAGKPAPTAAERAQLAEWLACGAP